MALQLEWNNEQQEHEIQEGLIAKLEELLRIAGEQEEIPAGEVALTFVDDEEIHRLNKEFRDVDRPTDVLSFPLLGEEGDEPPIDYSDLEELAEEDGEAPEPFDEAEPLGDIVISVPTALAQSKDYGHSFEREIGFLFIHGFLHLIGYDHETEEEEQEMMAKQERILLQAGLTR